MIDPTFCYCCRVYHPRAQMRLFKTHRGDCRWRCLRSIEAAASSAEVRDAFGREQTVANREDTRCAEQRAMRQHYEGLGLR